MWLRFVCAATRLRVSRFVQRALNDIFVCHESRSWRHFVCCVCHDSFPRVCLGFSRVIHRALNDCPLCVNVELTGLDLTCLGHVFVFVNQCTVAFPGQVWLAQRSGPIADW